MRWLSRLPAVSAAFAESPRNSATGHVVHFVTGDPVAFTHTANVIGGVDGEIIPLPVTELPSGAVEPAVPQARG